MTNNNKLKVLIVIMFFFIIVLVAMLIYVKSFYGQNDSPTDTTMTANYSTADTSAAATSAQNTSEVSDAKETIDLKLYIFDGDDYDNVKEIRSVAIDKKLYQEDITAAINELLSSTNLSISKAIVKDNSLIVDLSKEVELKFNSGSTGGITYTNILAATIVNLPGIEKMEVTVDGVAGVVADHFSFDGTFKRAEAGKKYVFTEVEY